MVKTVKLDSGVRLVMEKIDYVRSVAIGIWVKAGACDEDKANAGISHYIEHMMFKGTANRTAREIAADIDKIGGQINAFTGKEATCYYVKSTSEHYRESADVLVDMLTNTLLDPKDMKRERNVIREEIKMNADDPDDLAHETVTSLVFKGSPLGNSILGTYTSLGRISRPVMKNYIEKEYTRDSIVISVAGYFDEKEAEPVDGVSVDGSQEQTSTRTINDRLSYCEGLTSKDECWRIVLFSSSETKPVNTTLSFFSTF